MLRRITTRPNVRAAAISTFLSFIIVVGRAQVAPPLSEIKVIVFDETGAVIPDCEIVFRSDSETVVSHTGMDGSASVRLRSGRYAVTSSATGFVKSKVLYVQIATTTQNTFRVLLKVDHTPSDGAIVDGVPTAASELPSVIVPESFIVPDPYPQATKEVRVPDAATALKIAEPALIKTYGKRQMKDERPLTATLDAGIWTVSGTQRCKDRNGHRNCGLYVCFGGAAVLRLRQWDGKILSIQHYK